MTTEAIDSVGADRRVRPALWTETTIGEAFAFTQKARKIRYTDFDGIPYVPMDYVPIGYPYFDRYDLKPGSTLTTGTFFERGDLLVAKITPSFENGKQGIVTGLPLPFGVATTEVIPVHGVPEVSDTLFLFYYLHAHHVRSELAGKMEGTTGRQRLNKSAIDNWPILLPPLEEQRAIASVLLTVQEAVQTRRRELALERERKAALMHHLFTHGTRGEPRKQTEIGEMPESWRVSELGAVAQIAYGLTVNKTRRESPNLAPYLTVANVTRGALRLTEVKQIGTLDGDAETYRLQKGDVLFVEGNGNPQLLGSAAVWNDELPFALHQNHLIRARLDQAIALPVWVMSYFNSDTGRAQIMGRTKTSSGLHTINSRIISGLQMPIPSLPEQREIVCTFLASDKRVAALDREMVVLQELLQAMLNDLMTGAMRIPSKR